VDIPSYLVKVGGLVSLKDRSRKNEASRRRCLTGRGIPWLVQEADNFRGRSVPHPPADIPLPISNS
jgi:hypothetical protein